MVRAFLPTLLTLLLMPGCLDAASPGPDAGVPAGGEDVARVDEAGSIPCDGAPARASWHDEVLFDMLTADRGRWRFQSSSVGPSLPVPESIREEWGAHNLTEVTWEMEHEEEWAIHRDFSLDGRRFLSAEMEQRFSEQEVHAGFDAFLDRILADPDGADRDDLWMRFNRSRAEGDAWIVHRDDQGPPYWGHFFTYGLHLPRTLGLNVSAVVGAWLGDRSPRDHGGALDSQEVTVGPWRFQWDLEVRSVGFTGTEHEGHARLRVDANGGVTFNGALNEPDVTGEKWVSWLESILPETGARVPDRGELRFPPGAC